MIELSGRSVCGGVTFGKISIFSRNGRTVKRTHIQSAEEEIGRFLSARDSAVSELEVLYEKARVEIGEAQAQIFAIHQMMLEDEDYNDSVKNIISRHQTILRGCFQKQRMPICRSVPPMSRTFRTG